MKIQGTNNLSAVSGTMQTHPLRGTRPAASRFDRMMSRFDTVSIGSAAGRSSFEMELKSKITQEVRAAATPGRLSALSRQIQDGTYEPDAMTIARRMLLLAEDA